MAIYFGERGKVEITRQGSDEPLYTTLVPDDVNVGARRFSVVFMGGAITTGDYVTIKRRQSGADQENLELVKDHLFPDWSGFIHVDSIGGVRLYQAFDDALDGTKRAALELVTPSQDQDILFETRSLDSKCLAEVRSFQINTTRETIDTTVLSNQFRHSLKNGLISGQGQLECNWEHKRGMCEDQDSRIEFNAYLARLCVRLQQGAGFRGKFYIYCDSDERGVWYEADCIVSNVSISVSPANIIESTIDFVTTGPVQLKSGFEPSILAQESLERVLQEGGDPQFIDTPEDA